MCSSTKPPPFALPARHLAAVDLDALADADEPWPSCRSCCAVAVVADLDPQLVRLVVQRHVGTACARVLEHVREALLHDAVGGEIERRRKRRPARRRPATGRAVLRARLPEQRVEASRPGAGRARRRRRRCASRQEVRISASAVRPACSTAVSVSLSSASASGAGADGADLEHHHADRVRDDVVQLACDPCTFLGDGDPRGRVPLLLGLCRPHLRRLGLLGSLAQRESRDPADRELERDEDDSRRRVVRDGGDDDGRPGDRDAQADATPAGCCAGSRGGTRPPSRRGRG